MECNEFDHLTETIHQTQSIHFDYLKNLFAVPKRTQCVVTASKSPLFSARCRIFWSFAADTGTMIPSKRT